MASEEQLEADIESQEDTPWYEDSKYNRYWSHYSQMKAWVRAHDARHSVAGHAASNAWLQSYHQYYLHYQRCQYYNQYYRRPFPQTYQGHDNANHHYDNHHVSQHHTFTHPHQYSKHRGNSKQNATDQSDVDYQDNGVSESQVEDEEEIDLMHDDGDEFEVELSEEMRQFFLQSQKHKEELREIKLAFSKKRDQSDIMEDSTPEKIVTGSSSYQDEFVAPGSKKNKKKIVGAPSEQPGKRRAEEMKVLYGKDSPAIHGMETAIQMQFDRNCDKKQPSFWPTVPLKM